MLFDSCTHAADVLQNFYYFSHSTVMREALHPLDVLCGVLAAATHDVDHPGVNNLFLIHTAHEAALRYNDQSVLEHHHLAQTFRILNRTGLLAHLSKEETTYARSAIINMILNT
jgi:high affinity cAMP-specific 3',5'-cyclic phosphodiesterase 7